MKRRWIIILVIAFGIMGGGVLFGVASMGYDHDLRQLLGPDSESWLDHARVAAWQPDPDLKPLSYFVQRRADEATFRRLAGDAGLNVGPSAAVEEAIWRLPRDVALQAWAPDKVPAGAGLDARGTVGRAMVFARWYAGDLWMVIASNLQ